MDAHSHTGVGAGDAEVDQAVCSELRATGAFKYMDLDVDEVWARCMPLALPALLTLQTCGNGAQAEHSLELQMAFLMRIMR